MKRWIHWGSARATLGQQGSARANRKATEAPARTADAHATQTSWVYSRPSWPETPAQAKPGRTRVAPVNPTWGAAKNHEPRRSRIHEATSCTAWRANRIVVLSRETIPVGRKYKSLVTYVYRASEPPVFVEIFGNFSTSKIRNLEGSAPVFRPKTNHSWAARN